MRKPHPVYGIVRGNSVYGIRTISIYSNRLKSIVGDCTQASASEDARDKYFAELVSEVDLISRQRLSAVATVFTNQTAVMDALIAELEGTESSLQDCLTSKEKTVQTLKNEQSRLDNVATMLENLGILEVFALPVCVLTVQNITLSEYHRQLGIIPPLGLAVDSPIQGCGVISKHGGALVPGFYWIRPPCAQETVRAFCGPDGSTYAVVKVQDDGNVEHMKHVCDSIGLQPLQIVSGNEVPVLQDMLISMEWNNASPIAIAVDVAHNGTFFDISLQEDVTYPLLSRGVEHVSNTAGISTNGMYFFDRNLEKIGAAICFLSPRNIQNTR
eukprot:GHVQ01036328.1.p1 GENE.GHVQ01036328.1~~GHVQ01036328.1.p1  ORF type:complete len:328 (-),score=26.12 GHVQ01036328.1:2932-3915(-)